MHLPLLVDASQEEAIRQVKKGNSLVIQGPPGTGKSQLICNLLADYAAEGKRVLLVCQKRAAIDTVHNRLQEVGMENFTALVHDFQVDRKGLYQKISTQIDNVLAYKYENQGLNAIFLEREFDSVCRKIDRIVNDLAAFKSALFDDKKYGKSIKELYLLASHKTEKEIDLNDTYPFFHFSTLDTFLKKLDTLEQYQESFNLDEEESQFWQNRKTFKNLNLNQIPQLCEAVSGIAEIKENLIEIGEAFYLENTKEIAIINEYFSKYKLKKAYDHLKKAKEKKLRKKLF